MYRGTGLFLSGVLLGLAFQPGPVAAQLRGHGGPVRALAISGDGETALSGSFDSSAILWSLRHDAAQQVLRFHDSAVNAVALLTDGRAATAGEDGRIALWAPGGSAPATILVGHNRPVVGLAVSPDGGMLASASWDGTLRLWPLAGGDPVVLDGHRQNVNGVAFMPGGEAVVSAGYDSTVRIWPLREPSAAVVAALPTPLNAVVVAPDGEIAAAGADGRVYFLSPEGERVAAVEAVPTPVIALAISRDGAHLAAAGVQGAVAIIDRRQRRVVRTLVGPGFPVWSLAFFPDNRTLLTGGADRVIRRWDSDSGAEIGSPAGGAAEDPLAAYEGDPGARVFRACAACHTLTAAEGNRAGPSLHGIFGQHIATLPGYNYSEPLKHLDIVWTPETLAKLFEIARRATPPAPRCRSSRSARRRIARPS
jgi:cytochrome c